MFFREGGGGRDVRKERQRSGEHTDEGQQSDTDRRGEKKKREG